MNLNKPPLSEEQNALEEYVDFLLTDRSNVTPINRKASFAKKLKENKLEVINESVTDIIDLNLSHLNKDENKKLIEEDIREIVKEADKKNAELDLGLNRASTQTNQKGNLEVLTDLSKQPIQNDEKFKIDSVKKAPSFILESEEDELKKWDAILTKEKELNILGLEKEARKTDLNKKQSNLDAALGDKKSNQKVTPKNEYTLLQNELEKSRITSDRPPIFDELLPLKEPDERLANVERLLSRISLATKPTVLIDETIKPDIITTEPDLMASETVNEISEESVQATFLPRANLKTKDMLPSVFQTLIFNVGKLPLAVPLLKLGGIVHISEKEDITPLVGTPDWFMGLVPHERGNLMVIDTQKYLMPEKADSTHKPYEYLIILDDSNWAIACHSVDEAKNLTQDDIRWSAKASKRPWFGGMVVQYMSAIIEVDELINMLASHITD